MSRAPLFLADLIKIWYAIVRVGQPDYFKKYLWDRKGKNWQPVWEKLREEITSAGGANFESDPQPPYAGLTAAAQATGLQHRPPDGGRRPRVAPRTPDLGHLRRHRLLLSAFDALLRCRA